MPRSFLDTSALAKHYHPEVGTDEVDRIIGEPGAELFVSRLTLVEMVSAFASKVRVGEIDASEFAGLCKLFSTHVARGRYRVVRIVDVHYARARDLIASHGPVGQIRTLDALQLAVALEIHRRVPIDHFVCADRRLCDVATLSGLDVINL